MLKAIAVCLMIFGDHSKVSTAVLVDNADMTFIFHPSIIAFYMTSGPLFHEIKI